MQSPILEENNLTLKPLIPKIYEAVFAQFDGERESKFYRGERLIEAAERANEIVKDDPFLTLVMVKELGPLE